MTITVSMPYHGTPDTVARAVRSVLDQTYGDLVLVVVNDGDSAAAWRPLAGIDDDRLVRFDVKPNRGRYYADAVVLAACRTGWLHPVDSDDWLDSGRLAALAGARDGRDVVFGGYTGELLTGRSSRRLPVLRRGRVRPMARYTTLWRAGALRSIGGPHPDWRIGYDVLCVSLAAARLAAVVVADYGYHKVQRPNSLVRAAATRKGSEARQQARRERARLWEALQGRPLAELSAALAPHPGTAVAVARDAERLAGMLP